MVIDERIAEAIKVIGSLAEDDIGGVDLQEVEDTVLRLLYFVRATSLSKLHREAGHIQAALNQENLSDAFYDKLPEHCKW